jgi:hypothetical protein
MEKQVVTVSYWLGLLCSLIAFGLRLLNTFGIMTPIAFKPGQTISYMSFFNGALMFFVIAIATASYASVRSGKT